VGAKIGHQHVTKCSVHSKREEVKDGGRWADRHLEDERDETKY
jgi:hypothetical protein